MDRAISDGTLTRARLVEALGHEFGLSRDGGARLLEDMIELICEDLVAGQPVKLQNFGSFSVRQKGARRGRNPNTGQEVPIAPRRVVVFRPAGKLRAMVNDHTSVPRRRGGQMVLF